ncbi:MULTISPECIES: GntR family transcriptional regulator [Rhizobium]|uniref:GntR family transcriptional regulator n=1 Tax=Rhizobium TaxID=379 RepID=UPI00195876A8|nr:MULTISPECIES: GntR family transcriptional regulator [Rhizobium]MBM7044731.1 GntR family transcriptional regulator [Rhizobium lusitanum]
MSELSSPDPQSEENSASLQSSRGQRPEEQLLYDRLVDAIIDKTLRPGQHLNEVKLAATYAVPRSRVRRVLERLRDEAVVEIELNRGAFISRPTIAEARDVFEARKNLEMIIVRLACARATSADIDELRAHLTKERQVFDNLRPEMNRVAGDFHVLLAKTAGNAVLARMLTLLMRRVCLIQSLYEKRSGVLCLVHEHERLVDLIAANDPEGAAAEALHHCAHIESSLDLTERRRTEIDIYELP